MHINLVTTEMMIGEQMYVVNLFTMLVNLGKSSKLTVQAFVRIGKTVERENLTILGGCACKNGALIDHCACSLQ